MTCWKVFISGCISILTALALLGCTTSEGDGPRYIGRVESVEDGRLCVGRSSSSPDIECGKLPANATEVPSTGECVALFADEHPMRMWTEESLSLEVDDARCED